MLSCSEELLVGDGRFVVRVTLEVCAFLFIYRFAYVCVYAIVLACVCLCVGCTQMFVPFYFWAHSLNTGFVNLRFS